MPASGDAAGRVAIVIVNFNAGTWLTRCLDAVAAQARRPARVIVVDNASTDGSATSCGGHPEAGEWVALAQNIGFAAANNEGIRRAADCEWIVLLNPDAFPEPDWLDQLLQAARAHPEFACFASQQRLAEDPTRLDGAGDEYSVAGLAWRRGHGRPRAEVPDTPCEVFSPCAAAAMYRRAALIDAGGFDESFFCYFEDVDLALRLRLAGHRCLYVPRAIVRHVGSALTGVRSDFSAYHGHRNMVWTWVKNMPWPLMAIYWPHHVLLNVISVAWLARRGQLRVVLRAKRDAVRGLPAVWRRRRAVQSARRVTAADLRRHMVGGVRAFGAGRVLQRSTPET
jgi:GT2 family glycosyltransferase